MTSNLQSSSDDLHADADAAAWLSALADGEAQAAESACRLWRDDAGARQTWHAYHLIGDVMRSDELAATPARDAAFLAGVRARLAAEPTVLAPLPARMPSRRRQPWLVPAAAAAGFAVVAGVLVVARMGGLGAPTGAPVLATAARDVLVNSGAGPVQRDARLEEFLRAHQAARGGVAMAAPGGSLRRVEEVVTVPVPPAR